MSDEGDLWRDVREARAEKRATNRRVSAEMLVANGYGYESLNGGAHLRVEGRVDFWPGTGLWKDLQSERSGRGVRNLINHLQRTSQ